MRFGLAITAVFALLGGEARAASHVYLIRYVENAASKNYRVDTLELACREQYCRVIESRDHRIERHREISYQAASRLLDRFERKLKRNKSKFRAVASSLASIVVDFSHRQTRKVLRFEAHEGKSMPDALDMAVFQLEAELLKNLK